MSLTTLCALSLMAVYLTTIPSGISGGDSGELVAEACHLGTAHPPGYPLLTMVTHVFVRYLNWSTPAFRANLCSALLATACLWLLGKSIQLLSASLPVKHLGVVFGMSSLAISPLFWQYSITAEVFSMNNMFAMLIIYLTLLFSTYPQKRTLILGAFISSLSICNQHTIILFLIPIILWILFLSRKFLWKHPSFILTLSISFLAGLLPHIYLPYIASVDPKPGSWGHLSTFEGFLHHFTRKDYGTFQLFSGINVFLTIRNYHCR